MDFLNSSFSTSFFGAVAGSLTIIILGWFAQKRKTLTDINSSIGLLVSQVNMLLNIKRQHSLPLLTEYRANVLLFAELEKQKNEANVGKPQREFYFRLNLKQFQCPKLYFEVPLDKISQLASDRQTDLLVFLMMTKSLLVEVENACAVWNSNSRDLMTKSFSERINIYFCVESEEGVNNTHFSDTIENLNSAVDSALFFSNKALTNLIEIGKRNFPFWMFWLRRRIYKFEIVGPDKQLMPPEDFKEGW